jgi:acyl-coenzyme A synthetase/AMP-(fatty) acid ligase
MRDGKAVVSDAPDALELVGCGVPFPGHELAIVDEAGKPVGEPWWGRSSPAAPA